MGGPAESFRTTEWTQVASLRRADEAHRRTVLERLVGRYWKPVYCFLRRKGHANEDAKDLTQGFFVEIVFGSDLLQRASQAKGRFRTFLLTALQCYAADVLKYRHRRRRMPQAGLASLEAIDPAGAVVPAAAAAPPNGTIIKATAFGERSELSSFADQHVHQAALGLGGRPALAFGR